MASDWSLLQKSQPVKIPKQTLSTEVSETFVFTIYISDMAFVIISYPLLSGSRCLRRGMYFVMDPPIDSGTTDMGAGYCLVGELVYTISHPGVVPSLFDGREEISQWLADAAGSSSKFVNILSTAVLLPAITGSIQWSLFCSAHICLSVSDIDCLLHHHNVD